METTETHLLILMTISDIIQSLSSIYSKKTEADSENEISQ